MTPSRRRKARRVLNPSRAFDFFNAEKRRGGGAENVFVYFVYFVVKTANR